MQAAYQLATFVLTVASCVLKCRISSAKSVALWGVELGRWC